MIIKLFFLLADFHRKVFKGNLPQKVCCSHLTGFSNAMQFVPELT